MLELRVFHTGGVPYFGPYFWPATCTLTLILGLGIITLYLFTHTQVFNSDIERLLGMADLWKKRPPPKPLALRALFPEGLEAGFGAALAVSAPGVTACKVLGLTNPNQVWRVEEGRGLHPGVDRSQCGYCVDMCTAGSPDVRVLFTLQLMSLPQIPAALFHPDAIGPDAEMGHQGERQRLHHVPGPVPHPPFRGGGRSHL